MTSFFFCKYSQIDIFGKKAAWCVKVMTALFYARLCNTILLLCFDIKWLPFSFLFEQLLIQFF